MRKIERTNQTITKYLASFVNDDTMDWDDYLVPLIFSYNTSFHRSIKQMPHFMTIRVKPNMPSFPAANVRRKFYSEAKEDEIHQFLLYARDIARRNIEDSNDESKEDHDMKVTVDNFQEGQLVLLNEHSFLHKNLKLAAKWSGPHRITEIKSHANKELKLKNDKTLHVHAHQLKPYFVPISSKTVFQEPVRHRIPAPNPPQVISHIEDEPINKENLARFPQIPEEQQNNNANEETQLPVIFQEVFDEYVSDDDLTTTEMPKRGRGRPRRITARQNKFKYNNLPLK
jgi:hypothetical protein